MREIKFEILIEVSSKDFTKRVITHYTTIDRLINGDDSMDYSAVDIIAKRQYTGLKDKNGVEIYEGDVVVMPYISPFGGVQIDTPDFKSDVIFERGCFQVWCNDLKSRRHSIENWVERTEGEYKSNYGNVPKWGECVLTVIGNVYQNFELLEKHNAQN